MECHSAESENKTMDQRLTGFFKGPQMQEGVSP